MFFLDIGIKIKQNQQQQERNNFGFYLLNKSSKGKKAKCFVQLFVSTQMLFSWFCNVLCLKGFGFFFINVDTVLLSEIMSLSRWWKLRKMGLFLCADTEKILNKRTQVWNLGEYMFLTCLAIALLQYRFCASINETMKLLCYVCIWSIKIQ